MTYRVVTRLRQPKIQLKNVSHPPVVGKLADSLPLLSCMVLLQLAFRSKVTLGALKQGASRAVSYLRL